MTHAIADEYLLDYASGAACPPVGLLVATHLTLSPDARRSYRRLEAVGGALLESLEPTPTAPDALACVFARIDGGEAKAADRADPPRGGALGLPAPLASMIPNGVDALGWRRLAKGVEEATLDIGGRTAVKASLLRIAAGRAIPKHTHRGLEMTLVLDGAFADEAGRYGRGDVCVTDDTIEHQPIADRNRDCLCLAVTEAPIRLTGPIMRLLNPFLSR